MSRTPIGLFRVTRRAASSTSTRRLSRRSPSLISRLRGATVSDFFSIPRLAADQHRSAGQGVRDVEVRQRRWDGSVGWFRISSRAVQDDDGRVARYEGEHRGHPGAEGRGGAARVHRPGAPRTPVAALTGRIVEAQRRARRIARELHDGVSIDRAHAQLEASAWLTGRRPRRLWRPDPASDCRPVARPSSTSRPDTTTRPPARPSVAPRRYRAHGRA